MRIGLFSPHFAFNYGAVLQAFALKTFLIEHGYDAVIINRRPEYHCAIPSLFGRIARRIEELAKFNSFGKFEREYLQPQTELIVHQTDWSKFEKFNLDAVIVGSDQIWRDDYCFTSFGYNLFLDFITDKSIKKISYAPSLGKESWNADPEATMRSWGNLCSPARWIACCSTSAGCRGQTTRSFPTRRAAFSIISMSKSPPSTCAAFLASSHSKETPSDILAEKKIGI